MVIGNNENCERAVSHDKEIAKQEMKPVLTINRKWWDGCENKL